tara:strand:- start:523 stop:1455 length:933 start_codon:yes stop_codon:yes gene_type:complete
MKQLNIYKNLIIILFFLTHINLVFAVENKILVKVNNEIITTIDIYNQIKYMNILNPEIKNLDNERLFEISKNSLIREKIKKIYLLKIVDKIYMDDKNFKTIIKNFYKQRRLNSIEEYKVFLKKNKLDYEYVKYKFTIERLWNEMIFQKFNSKIKINRENIKKEILNNPDEKLLLSEILIPKSKEKELQIKYKQIEIDIKKEGFSNAASIHSISETAAKGGNIGWIEKNSLNKAIRDKLSNLNIGEYTKPIITPSGFLIIKVENKKLNKTSKEDLNKKIERLVRIKTNQQLNQFSNIYLNKLKNNVKINEI